MLFKTDFINEFHIGINNVLWFLIAERPDQNGNDSFRDDGITISGKHQFVTIEFGMYPHLALASFDQVVIGFVLFGYQWK